MNIIGFIILSTLIFEFSLNLIADILNLKVLSEKLPEEFQDVYDAKTYRKSQAYMRVNTRFGWITSIFDLSIMLFFWFSGGFQFLDVIVRNWNHHAIWNGLIYIGFLMFFRTVLSLPFNIYATFVIEERFGFNKTTPATYIKDLFKELALSIIIGGPLLAGILAFFQYGGNLAWLYCWIATTIFSLIIQFIAPTWIMPLFNKFTPLEEGELRNQITTYAKSVNYPLAGVFVMDGSRRSTKSNAFFTGFGKNKRIALFDTLISKHTIKEIVAILAHEIGHFKKKHILINMAIGIIHTGIIFFLISLFLTQKILFEAFYVQEMSVYTGLLFFGMLYSPVELILSLFMNILSRKNEYQADNFAAGTMGESIHLITALKKLSVNNLSNLTPHPFYVFLTYSHPPLMKRIQNLKMNDTKLEGSYHD